MSIKKALTPKNTEEIRPGLFLQTKEGIGGRVVYRVVHPAVWDDKWRIKEQLRTLFSIRTLVSLGFILFMVWAYLHDNQAIKGFYTEFSANPLSWCQEYIAEVQQAGKCRPEWEKIGICGSGLNLELLEKDIPLT